LSYSVEFVIVIRMEPLEIIVVILGIFLALFLAVAITLCVLLIRFARKLNDLTEKADDIAGGFMKVKGIVTPTMILSKIISVGRSTYKAAQSENTKKNTSKKT